MFYDNNRSVDMSTQINAKCILRKKIFDKKEFFEKKEILTKKKRLRKKMFGEIYFENPCRLQGVHQ